MDWSDILGIIMAIAVAVGLPLALHSRQKGGQKKAEELCQHLAGMGIKAYPGKAEIGEGKVKRSRSEKSLGVIEVKQRNIDWINIIGVASQYGANYFVDYLVRSPNLGVVKLNRTSLRKKKEHSLWGRVSTVEWIGDKSLSQSLNLDHRLESMLMQSQFGGTIQIVPEPKWGYVRIRTNYFLPSPDVFEAIDIVGEHIRSGYG